MKLFVVVGLLCLVGLSVSYPDDREEQQQQFAPRRNSFRRRNGGAPTANGNAQQLRAKRPESSKKKFEPTIVEAPARFQNAEPAASKRRAPTVVNAPIETRQDNYQAASNAYAGYDAGTYDEGHLKFEQGVQNQASSYNSDYGVEKGQVNFAISGQQGPNSYRFGYDTGKGAHRVFRIEERDAEGIIHGRYGYYDPTGKFRIVNYSAHPKYGFQAEGDFGPK